MAVQELSQFFVGHFPLLDEGEGLPLDVVVVDVGPDLLLVEAVQGVHIFFQLRMVVEIPDGGNPVLPQLL